MSTSYAVVTEGYVQRHYIKKFEKKYKGAWDATWRGVVEELRRFDALKETDIADFISRAGQHEIWKTDFRIHGTKQSRKSSGDRCIVDVDIQGRTVRVLLVYHKNDLEGSGSETARFKKIIKAQYPELGV